MSEKRVHSESSDVDSRLAHVDALAEAEPEHAGALLSGIDVASLSAEGRSHFAFLLNHVYGRALGLWDEALAGQAEILRAAGDAATSALLQQAAVAAQAAGDAARALAWVQALANAAQASPHSAAALVTLNAVTLSVSKQDAETAGRLTLRVLQPLASLQARPVRALDAAFATVTRDLARDLLSRPLPAFDQPELRTAVSLTAQHSERFWRRCGHWVDLHRAYHLRAQAANTLGEGLHAAAHAREGLALIDEHSGDSNDDEDRAFLQLELAQGLRLARVNGADEAQRDAEQLAALFEDTGRIRRFAQRVQHNAALSAHYTRP